MLQNKSGCMKFVNKFIFLLFCWSSVSFAASLEDVEVLKYDVAPDRLSLTLQVQNADPSSFFYVDITKSDPIAFEKTMLVLQKISQKDSFVLSLNIPSFSLTPSGSYYKSESVTFINGGQRSPNGIKGKKLKK